MTKPVNGSMNSSVSGPIFDLWYSTRDFSSLVAGGRLRNQRVWSSGSLIVISTSMVISDENWERHGANNRKRLSQLKKYFSLRERSVSVSTRDC